MLRTDIDNRGNENVPAPTLMEWTFVGSLHMIDPIGILYGCLNVSSYINRNISVFAPRFALRTSAEEICFSTVRSAHYRYY